MLPRPKMGAMTTKENEPGAYPQYDENGNQNPVRVPPTEESEQWEMDIIHATADYDPTDPDTLANEPNE